MTGLAWEAEVAMREDRGEDRAFVSGADVRWTLAVADGAGGGGYGAEAAAAAVEAARDSVTGPRLEAAERLRRIDQGLAATGRGLTTAVVARVDGTTVLGASVGDSVAWARTPAGWCELTADQRRRPLLGSGAATPVPFRAESVRCLVLATDGLTAHLPWPRLRRLLEEDASAHDLAEAARLPGGGLPDDVTVVVLRRGDR